MLNYVLQYILVVHCFSTAEGSTKGKLDDVSMPMYGCSTGCFLQHIQIHERIQIENSVENRIIRVRKGKE